MKKTITVLLVLAMLCAAGWSVAVSNAREEVRSQCSDVCGTNNQDGVARYLADLFSLPADELTPPDPIRDSAIVWKTMMQLTSQQEGGPAHD